MSLATAVTHSYRNRAEVKASHTCACFHCLAKFSPDQIKIWRDSDDPDYDGGPITDDGPFPGMTAACPVCDYDSVIGSASGLNLTDEFLCALDRYWHGEKKKQQNEK
jgi:hypothetical protein